MSRHRVLWRQMWFTCHECGRDIPEPRPSQFHLFYNRGRMYCSVECSNQFMSRLFTKPKPIINAAKRPSGPRALWKLRWFNCHECGMDIPNPTVNQYKLFQRVGRMYCGKECSARRVSRINSKRMTLDNPMRDPRTRHKMSKTMKRNGHQPPHQGGKGRELPLSQQVLWERLGPVWEVEYVIKTGLPKGDGNATWYAADLAHLSTKTCVEVDGGSHLCLAAQRRDARRDAILSQLGWQTLRYTNEEVLADPDRVARQVMSTISRSKATKITSPTMS